MSGGVDSSVAAALLTEQGHDVVGATLKLWGGESDSGCCSVADVDDARRVAQQLSIAHHVFDYTGAFSAEVVSPYVEAHEAGLTPNPCIECNRHIKFDRLLERARRLGFDALATGHHARVVRQARGGHGLRRGADEAKDQSYVLSMLGQSQLAHLSLPVGHLTKAEVRAHATRLGLRTAAKPDSQDVCFIQQSQGREGFLADRIEAAPGVLEDASGAEVGAVPAVQLVTVGQRRGMGHNPDGSRRYVVSVDVPARRVKVGPLAHAMVGAVALDPASLTWVGEPLSSGSRAVAQLSAHGRPVPCTVELNSAGNQPEPDRPPSVGSVPLVRFDDPQRPVAPGQTVALYHEGSPDDVVGSAIASRAVSSGAITSDALAGSGDANGQP